ncbi:hypothetical protein PJ15_2160 [Acinetobacter sp. neg1]|jgi:hypothetical protein|uniref:hypothetical protein n=1 Tax=Acinetobacter TaxID=469 RepID=UPI000542EACB|nr:MULTISPECIES: hypothetical protein [Acinetobacter]KHF75956.1 hypothetical protein PJ15_2160 [Acinetobacter sp. neg1]KYQ82569.1 hypothetical protein AWW72_17760 [Acinetobacter sp. NRRL B-65365]MBJ8481564.1 hypothetical protein [Acinetobacter vivianii]
MTKVTKSTTTSTSNPPTQKVILKPEAELHLLVGSSYGEGKTESPYGHTAVYIKLKGKDYIYDFGRYGKTKPESIGPFTLEGSNSPRGEGVLRVWDDFQAYIADENRQGLGTAKSRTTYAYGYRIFDSQAINVLNYYNKLIENSRPFQARAHFKSYILAQDYFALAPNCTTQSLEATKKAIPSMAKTGYKFVNAEKVLPTTVKLAFKASSYEMPKYLFLPDNLNDYLLVSPDVKVDIKNTYRH